MNDIRPRKVAATIIAMPRNARAEAIKNIDGDTMRSAVKLYVSAYESRVDSLVKFVLLGHDLDARRDRIAHVPATMREEVKALVKERFEKRRKDAPR